MHGGSCGRRKDERNGPELELKRRTLMLGIACCALPGCASKTSRSSSAPASTERPTTGSPSSPIRTKTIPPPTFAASDATANNPVVVHPASRETLIQRYSGEQPKAWGEAVPGVVRRLPTSDRVVALTLDACGGRAGSGYDSTLIEMLRRDGVPATLFVNARWIEANPQQFRRLAADPLFQIGNHGTQHRPLSVTGRSVYGITGTTSVAEVIDEVSVNQRLITELTGATPTAFRSGTAYYDDVAVRIVADLGLRVVNFDVLGDAGATYSAAQVSQAMLRCAPGSIILAHMNRPDSGTADGVRATLPELSRRGFRLVHLSEYLG